MIVRYEEDGSLVMITQVDHAKLAGLLAAHWGNDEFERPRPFASAVRAAMYHDCGWFRYETRPQFDEATGRTPNYTQVSSDAQQLDAFRWGIRWLTDNDPYAGLLINKHRTGLWQRRYDVIKNPAARERAMLPDPVQEFIAEHEAEQQRAEAALDRNEVATNYRLLQVWDYLSLHLCSGNHQQEFQVDPVPTGYTERPKVRLTLKLVSNGRIFVAPYPFDRPELEVGVVYRRIESAKFRNEADFHEAYYRAAPRISSLVLAS